MTKFKIGDPVKIVRSFKSEMNGSNVMYNKDMEADISKVGTISRDSGYAPGYFFVKTENSEWNWHESSLELVVENSMPELTTGMRVKVRNGDVFIVVKELDKLFQPNGFLYMTSYDTTGKYDSEGYPDDEWDIVEVYEGDVWASFLDIEDVGKLLWQTEDPEKIVRFKRCAELHEIIANAQRELNTLAVD